MFSLISAWINRWVNNGEAGDLRRHCVHYGVIVMIRCIMCNDSVTLGGRAWLADSNGFTAHVIHLGLKLLSRFPLALYTKWRDMRYIYLSRGKQEVLPLTHNVRSLSKWVKRHICMGTPMVTNRISQVRCEMFFAYPSKVEVIHEIIEHKYTQKLSEYSLFKPPKFHFRTFHIVISRQKIYRLTIDIARQCLPFTAINVIIMTLGRKWK